MTTAATQTARIEALTNAVETATENWTGRDWTDLAIEALEQAAKDLREGSTDIDFSEATTQQQDGSYEEQQRVKCWEDAVNCTEHALRQHPEGLPEELVEELASRLERVAEANDQLVTDAADNAAGQGRIAIDEATAGDWESACEALQAACSYESHYGDDPTWSKPHGIALGYKTADEAEAEAEAEEEYRLQLS